MSKIQKLLEKLRNKSVNLSFDEVTKIFKHFGYELDESGNGSRITFAKGNKKFKMHKPHPKPILKAYQVNDIINYLKEEENYE